MADLKAKVTFLADTKGLLKGVDAVEGRFNKLGNALERHSAKLMGAGLAIGAGLAVAVKVAGDFDQSLRNMASVAKPTEQEFKAIHDMALKLGRESIHGPRKLAEVTYTLASAGMDAAKQMKVLPGIATLAAATQADLAQSTDLVTGALDMFGYEAEETDRVINAMAATIGLSKGTMDKLQESLKDSGTIAGQLGMDIEDLLVPLAALYDKNVVATSAGVGLRKIMLQLQNPAKGLTDLLDRLGLSTADVSSETHTIIEAFDVLKRAGASTTDIMNAFGEEAATIAAVLASKTTAELNKNTEAITGTKRAYEMAEEQAKGFGQTLALTKAALEGAGIAVGEVLLPYVKDMAIYVATAAISLSDLNPKLLDFGIKALAIGSALLIGVPALAKFSVGAAALGISLGGLSAGLAGLGAVGVTAAGIIWGMNAAWDAINESIGEYADKLATATEEEKKSIAQRIGFLAALRAAFQAVTGAVGLVPPGMADVADVTDAVGETMLTASERAETLVTSLIDGVTAAFDEVGTATDKAIDPLTLADMQFAALLATLDDLTSLEKYDLLMASIAANSGMVAAATQTIVTPLRDINETMLALPDPQMTLGERFLAAGVLAQQGLSETLDWLTDIGGMMTTALPNAGNAMVGAFANVYGSLGKLDKMTWKTMKKAMAGGMKAILDQFIDMTLGKMLATKIQAIANLGMGAFLNPANLGYIALVGGIYGAAKAAISGINSFDESAVFTQGGHMSGNVSVGDTIVSPRAMKNFMDGNAGGGGVSVVVHFNGSYQGGSDELHNDFDYLAHRIALAVDNG